MKSIVYHNFDDNYFDRELLPVLKNSGVTIVAISHDDMLGIDFDSVILFQDMMIKLQRDLVKNCAKKVKKPFIALSTKNQNWGQEILNAVNKFNETLILPPVSSPVASVSEVIEPSTLTDEQSESIQIEDSITDEKDKIINELQKTLTKKENEFNSLKSFSFEKNKKIHDLRESLEQKETEITDLNKIVTEKDEYILLCENTNTKLITADIQANNATIIDLRNKNKTLNSKIDRLDESIIQKDKIIAEKNEYILLCESEMKKRAAIIETNETIINDLDTQSRKLQSTISILHREISAISTLNQKGLISDSESLERLFSIVDDVNDS